MLRIHRFCWLPLFLVLAIPLCGLSSELSRRFTIIITPQNLPVIVAEGDR